MSKSDPGFWKAVTFPNLNEKVGKVWKVGRFSGNRITFSLFRSLFLEIDQLFGKSTRKIENRSLFPETGSLLTKPRPPPTFLVDFDHFSNFFDGFSGIRVQSWKPTPKVGKWAKKVAKIDLFLKKRKKVKKRRALPVTNIFMPDFRHAHTLQQSLLSFSSTLSGLDKGISLLWTRQKQTNNAKRYIRNQQIKKQ